MSIYSLVLWFVVAAVCFLSLFYFGVEIFENVVKIFKREIFNAFRICPLVKGIVYSKHINCIHSTRVFHATEVEVERRAWSLVTHQANMESGPLFKTCIIHCSDDESLLISPKDLDSLKFLLKAATIRNHRPLLDWAENAKEGEIPHVSYHRKCRSFITMKRGLESS